MIKFFLRYQKIPLLLIFLTLTCCSKKVVFDPLDSQSDFISFGNGGGFTGSVTKYYLQPAGHIYKKENDSFVKIARIPKNIANQHFINYNTLGIANTKLNDPGNRYFFIERKEKEYEHAIKWGATPLENNNIETFYHILMNVIKTNPKI